MKFQFSVTIEGFLVIEAESEQEAKDIVEDGYSLTDIIVREKKRLL